MEKKETRISDIISTGPLEELDDYMIAFTAGAARDFTFEHVDEITGVLEALVPSSMGGKTYKQRRDATRKALDLIQKEYPNTEMAGRVVSAIGQMLLTSGGAAIPKTLGVLAAKYGFKPVLNNMPRVAKYIKESPALRAFIENVRDTGANLIGEAKEVEDIKSDLIEKPDMAITTALGAAGKIGKEGVALTKKAKNYLPTFIGLAKHMQPETIQYIKKNYDSFLPRGKQTTKQERVDGILNWVNDTRENLEAVRLKGLNLLDNELPMEHLSKKKISNSINNNILELFKRKGYEKGAFGTTPEKLNQLQKLLYSNKTMDEILDESENLVSSRPMFERLLELRDFIKNGDEFLTETQMKSFVQNKLDNMAMYSKGQIRDSFGNVREFPIDAKDLSVVRDLRKRVDSFIGEGNPEYKKTMAAYNNLSPHFDSANKQNIFELLGLKLDEGRAISESLDKTDSAIIKFVMNEKKQKDPGMRKLLKAFVAARRAEKLAKVSKRVKQTDIAKEYNKYKEQFLPEAKKGIVQDKFSDQEKAEKFIRFAKDYFEGTLDGELDFRNITYPTRGLTQKAAGFIIGLVLSKKKFLDQATAIAEVEKIANQTKKNPGYLKKLGYEGPVRLAAPTTRIGLDFAQQPSSQDQVTSPEVEAEEDELDIPETDEPLDMPSSPVTPQKNFKELDEPLELPETDEPLGMQNQNFEQEGLEEQPEMYGAPGLKRETPRPPVGNYEVEEDPMNPEEDDRFQREEKVQSFLDQQTGGKKPKQRYA